MRSLALPYLLLAAWLTCLPACATAVPGAAHTAEARALFLELEPLAASGGLDQRAAALARLEQYPLYPYLIAADLAWRLRFTPGPGLDRQIAAFIDAHPSLPPAGDLRYDWIESLAARALWAAVRARVTPADSTALRCLALTGAIRLGAPGAAELQRRALEFWFHGASQPEACNPVFAWLEARGALTPARIVERARLAVLAGHYSLARYLRGLLPEDQDSPISRWLNIATNPGDLHTIQHLPPEIAVYAYKRLALRDLEGAAALLPALNARMELGQAHLYEMRRWTALLFAQNHRPEALAWFAKLDQARMDDFARGWYARSALLQGEWALALAVIEAFPPAQASEEEWVYWHGRALAAAGRHEEARRVLAPLSEKRSYHGYLAADFLEQPYSFNIDPLKVQEARREALLASPPVQRAREFLALGRAYQARVEWLAATDGLAPPALRQAALLAHHWGWHPMAIITLADSDYWDDLGIRYPLHYQEEAIARARETGLDPAYILAIIRTESLFMAGIHSGAGAVGLMQLMPATADQVAAELGMPAPNNEDLETPAINIRLGSRYLRNMLERFDGHLALATAAYNAGPSKVEEWLPQRPLQAEIWIAAIPYTETREYVQRAFSHYTVYQMRLGEEPQRIAELLPPIPPAQMLLSRLRRGPHE